MLRYDCIGKNLVADATDLVAMYSPAEMGQFVLKIWAVEGFQKQKKKKNICFVWLIYLTISIWEFRLIVVDHIT